MQIKTLVFNPFYENTYLVYDETGEAIIIDPGCYSAEEENTIVQFIEENKLKPVRLLNTHCHIDHILGNDFVEKKYNLKSEAHQTEELLAKTAKEYGASYGLHLKKTPEIGSYLNEGDIIEFGNSQLDIVHIPGHSPGGLVFFSQKESFMIVGDVLFEGSIGRSDLPGGNYNKLITSIKSKLFPLGDDMVVYPGHGPVTTIKNERLHNPFLD